MITENTVLVLGAGASKPYGYPTALELREKIIYNFIPEFTKFLNETYGGSDREKDPYLKRISLMIEAFKKSSTSSIDLFLSRNKIFDKHGKDVITFLLSKYEMTSKFREDVDSRNHDWYFTLYNFLTKDITTTEDLKNFSQNKLKVITFNYDRSFEHFIYESLQNSFVGNEPEINKLMRDFSVIHIYGKIAPLDWEPIPGISYKNPHLVQLYNDYSKNLQIIYDERKSSQEQIIETLSEAKNIFFLGFGFAEENLNALGLDKFQFSPEQNIYGTAFGLTQNEIFKCQNLLRENNSHMMIEKFLLENCDSLTLLRNHL